MTATDPEPPSSPADRAMAWWLKEMLHGCALSGPQFQGSWNDPSSCIHCIYWSAHESEKVALGHDCQSSSSLRCACLGLTNGFLLLDVFTLCSGLGLFTEMRSLETIVFTTPGSFCIWKLFSDVEEKIFFSLRYCLVFFMKLPNFSFEISFTVET